MVTQNRIELFLLNQTRFNHIRSLISVLIEGKPTSEKPNTSKEETESTIKVESTTTTTEPPVVLSAADLARYSCCDRMLDCGGKCTTLISEKNAKDLQACQAQCIKDNKCCYKPDAATTESGDKAENGNAEKEETHRKSITSTNSNFEFLKT